MPNQNSMGEQQRGKTWHFIRYTSISIDYAVMERSKKVVSAQFEWSDLGSFESVYDYLKNNWSSRG
jgi:mannose-1-phosphate guanylyltransferase